jgi:hypothetical protein
VKIQDRLVNIVTKFFKTVVELNYLEMIKHNILCVLSTGTEEDKPAALLTRLAAVCASETPIKLTVPHPMRQLRARGLHSFLLHLMMRHMARDEMHIGLASVLGTLKK